MADPQSHSEPHPDVAGYLLRALDDGEAAAFASHLAVCDACRTEVGELTRLPGLLTDVADSWELPAGLEERTFLAVAAAAATPPTPALPGGNVVPITAARHYPRRLIIAVAAVATAVAGVVGLTSLRSNAPAPTAVVHLVATNGGPAHGEAVIHATPAGLTIDMTVDDLPPAPAGKMYTCWLVAGDDTLAHPDRVSVGSFRVPGKTVHARWTTAADLSRFPRIGITLEPDNGNPSHQGPKVLTGS